MVEINASYEGELHTSVVHGPSGRVIETDAPTDNHGRGAAFSPTDLVAAGLGTCMMTVMGIVARERGYALEGTSIRVMKEMTFSGPRRIQRLSVTVSAPTMVAEELNTDARGRLEQVARSCPVRLSISETIEVPILFIWGADSRVLAPKVPKPTQ